MIMMMIIIIINLLLLLLLRKDNLAVSMQAIIVCAGLKPGNR